MPDAPCPTVCAALAARALGPGKVCGLLLPERDSSTDSTRRAWILARHLRVECIQQDITAVLEAIGCYAQRHVAVAFGAFLSHPTARLGRGVVVGSYSIIGNAEIEDGVLIASRVSILSGKHQHGSPYTKDAVTPHTSFARVRIGEGSWIGEGAVIMASVGKKCVVAAGSVVTRPAPDGSIAVGNPARFLRPGAAADPT